MNAFTSQVLLLLVRQRQWKMMPQTTNLEWTPPVSWDFCLILLDKEHPLLSPEVIHKWSFNEALNNIQSLPKTNLHWPFRRTLLTVWLFTTIYLSNHNTGVKVYYYLFTSMFSNFDRNFPIYSCIPQGKKKS